MEQDTGKTAKRKRLGDLLLEMGFINEEQLQQALKLAKEKKIKIGEALHEIKAIDPDQIYWMLGKQLNMDYLDLDPKTIDPDLMADYDLEELRELKCIPLYSMGNVIHFAVVDPSDKEKLQEILDLHSDETVSFHLALPDKIENALDYFEKRRLPHQLDESVVDSEPDVDGDFESGGDEDFPYNEAWEDLLDILEDLERDEILWVKLRCEIMEFWKQSKGKMRSLGTYPWPLISVFCKRLSRITHPNAERIVHFDALDITGGYLRTRMTMHLTGTVVRLECLPYFFPEEFMEKKVAASCVNALLKRAVEVGKLLVAGDDPVFLKKCLYSLMDSDDFSQEFPTPVYIEDNIIGAIDVGAAQFPGVPDLLEEVIDLYKGAPVPFLVFQSKSALPEFYNKAIVLLNEIDAQWTIIQTPFESREKFQSFAEKLNVRQEFKPLFVKKKKIHELQLKE